MWVWEGEEEKVKRESEERKGWERRTRGNGMVKIGKEQTENKERDIFIEGMIIGLARNLGVEKIPEIHKNEPD